MARCAFFHGGGAACYKLSGSGGASVRREGGRRLASAPRRCASFPPRWGGALSALACRVRRWRRKQVEGKPHRPMASAGWSRCCTPSQAGQCRLGGVGRRRPCRPCRPRVERVVVDPCAAAPIQRQSHSPACLGPHCVRVGAQTCIRRRAGASSSGNQDNAFDLSLRALARQPCLH